MYRALIVGAGDAAHGLRIALLAEGLITAVVTETAGGIRQARVRPYDVVILLTGDDHDDAVASVSELRGACESALVVLLVGKEQGPFARAALISAGADDCAPGDADTEELVARVVAAYRRRRMSAGPSPVAAGSRASDLELPTRTVRIGEKTLHLTRTEALLMQALSHQPGKTVARTALGEHVFGDRYPDAGRRVDVQVCRLRKKLRQLEGQPMEIVTVPGVGYSLRTAAVSTVA